MVMMMMMMVVMVDGDWWGKVMRSRRRGERTSNNSSNTKKISKREFFQNLREGIPKYLYSRQGSLGDQATTCRFVQITLVSSNPCIFTRHGGTLKIKKRKKEKKRRRGKPMNELRLRLLARE